MPNWKILLAPDVGANIPSSGKNGYIVRHNTSMLIPCHPDYENRGLWVNGSPMTKYIIMVEPFGQYEIPSGSVLTGYIQTISNEKVLQIKFETLFDVSTGDCRLETSIRTGSGANDYTVFNVQSKNCAVDVPVHQTVQDAMTFRQSQRELTYGQIEAALGFITGGAGLLSKGNFQSMAMAAAKNPEGNVFDPANIGSPQGLIKHAINTDRTLKSIVDSATQANQVSVSGQGSAGSYLSFTKDLITPKIFCYFNEIVSEYNKEKGRPLCAPRQISNLSGYIMCDSADIETTGTSAENIAINSYLNGGFYYE